MPRATGFPQPILDIADAEDRRAAAVAAAGGAGMFYAFGNFCALAAAPDLESMRRMNRLKGRPLDQVGSVTTTPERVPLIFDWAQLPESLDRRVIENLMADCRHLGPIGFRGPAAAIVPDHLTVIDQGIKTAQVITPGDACPSNLLVGDILDRLDEVLLFITSANTSSNVTRQTEAAHYEMRAIQREFGHKPHVVLIGHRNERANRRRYPRHAPCSTSIVAFHRDATENGRPALVLERLGSLPASDIRRIVARYGLGLQIAGTARERVPVRRPRRIAFTRTARVLSLR
jgi:tRNA A37 threonylcarbamoyladenosine synthetase subunit TsaC/SUA5/YrdC